ncbi:MAG: hypothetical protein ACLPKE_09880 [Streptosporangiaceae bacterium]
MLELGLGNYQPAPRCALGVFHDDALVLGAHVLPDLVEAAARCGETGIANRRSRQLHGCAPGITPDPCFVTRGQ